MGIFSGISGNASQISPEKIEQEFADSLVDGEHIESAYQLVRDLYIFTNKRLILVDKQGLTGSKVEYLSVPYRAITRFAVETAGSFDRDAELRIWVSGSSHPIEKEFKRGSNILEVQRTLAQHVLR